MQTAMNVIGGKMMLKKHQRRRTADQASVMQDMNRKIGERLRMARASLDMSQVALGKVMGVTFQQVQKYETGVNRLPIACLALFCKETGINMASFFTDLDVPMDDGLDINAKTTGRVARRFLSAFLKISDPVAQSSVLHIVESIVAAEDRETVREAIRHVR